MPNTAPLLVRAASAADGDSPADTGLGKRGSQALKVPTAEIHDKLGRIVGDSLLANPLPHGSLAHLTGFGAGPAISEMDAPMALRADLQAVRDRLRMEPGLGYRGMQLQDAGEAADGDAIL